MKSKALFILFFFLTLNALVYAQETPAGEQPPASEQNATADADVSQELTEEKDPPGGKLSAAEKQRTELELKASTMPELAVWCRSLGLSEGGTKEELARRIREHFGLKEPVNTDEDRKVLIIESAQSTEYFKVDVIDEDYARLKGDVRLVLHDNDDVHRIKADEVLFNRSRNIITASGKVEYTKVKGDTTEIFRGEKITVNIDDWDSVFLNGDSEKTLSDENTAYRFEGTVISRSYDDVTILKNARISNAKNEEALWSISGSKLWLLPGSDFAIFNLVLKVGEIPVLYFPFFYYSADDLIFHPVIGYRTREGGFVQTSSYILGRPKTNETEKSSITKILGNSEDMEKKLNGIFLRSTGKKAVNQDARTLKLMADYYVNLGLYTGVDLILPQAGILSSFDLSLGTGFSRTLEKKGEDYTPYIKNKDGIYDGSVEWNESNLFSKTMPFRYRMKTQGSLRGKYGGFSWAVPFYADPYIDRDFYQNRTEAMDWFKMIQNDQEKTEDELNQQNISGQQWQINGNISPSVGFLSPYISSLSLGSITTSLTFKIIDDERYKNTEHPGRQFFAPDKYVIYNASGSIMGTPLTIGKKTNAEIKEEEKTEPENPLSGIGTPRSPWKDSENTTEKTTTSDNLAPPALNKTFDLPGSGNAKFSIGYQLNPSGSSELQFMSGYEHWKKIEDVNWSEVQSILSTFSGNGNINFNFDHSENLYKNSLTFSGRGTWQDYNFLNEEADAYQTQGVKDDAKIEAAKKQQYSYTNYLSSYAFSSTVNPLYKDPVFGQSNIQYNFEGTLVKSKPYKINERTAEDGPELTPQWGTFKKEETKDGEEILGIRSHKLTSNLFANVMDNTQNLSVSADLPPRDPLISTNATLKAWYSTTTARMEFKKPETVFNKQTNINELNDRWIMDPLHINETLAFGNISTFSYYMVMEPEDDFKVTTVTSSLSLWDFKAVFTAVKSNRLKFTPDNPDHPAQGGKWLQIPDEDPTLHPKDLTLTYVKKTPELDIVKNRLSLSMNVDTKLLYDLQKHTNSNLQFTAGFSLLINKFMDLKLSATSKNMVVFRYFKGIPGMEKYTQMYIDGPQNNVLTDLVDSFNFFDTSKRERSGFKMERFNIEAIHHLGDWDATLKVVMSPYLDTKSTPQKYDINTEITFLVQWSSISEIKTDLKYEKKTETWVKN